MQEAPTLTPTSFIVLGFVSLFGEVTPYQLKRLVSGSVGYFWSFPHSQLYAEPERLARLGHLEERREEGGRRRKRYTLTTRGREALGDWVSSPTANRTEIRDMASLQLFFGADPSRLAQVELDKTQALLEELEGRREAAASVGPPGPLLSLNYGITLMRAALAFWSELATREAADDAAAGDR